MVPPLNITPPAYPFLTLSFVLTQVTACLVTRSQNSWKLTCKESWLKRRTRRHYEKEHSQLESWLLLKSYFVLLFKALWVLVSSICLGLHQSMSAPSPLCRASLFYLPMAFTGLPGGWDGKESVCNAGDLGSIPGSEDPLEKGMATHSNILAWRIPRTEEPGTL